MKMLSDSEKWELIRYYGARLARANMGRADRRSEILDGAQRVIELAKSMPKIQFAPED